MMTDLALKWVLQCGPWRRPVAIAGALAVHSLVLGYIALRGLSGVGGQYAGPIDDPFPVFNVWIEPRPMSFGSAGRLRNGPVSIPPISDFPLGTSSSEADGFKDPKTRSRESVPSNALPDAAVVGGAATPGPSLNTAARPMRQRPDCRGSSLGFGHLTAADQALCDQRFGDVAARSRSPGSPRLTAAESRREDRFARDGEAALGAFEERERPLAPNARARPCPPGPSPREECEVSISGRLWSNRDGWLPDLPRPH